MTKHKQTIETHPFGDFIPQNSKYLLIGSFTTKPKDDYVWFYANGRNHFWPIMENVFEIELKTKNSQQQLFEDLNMALSDIIYSCERKNGSNLDNNLINIVYNIKGITNIIENNKIEKIFFSSRFVETKFKKIFKGIIEANPHIELVYLPSPSPRYAAMNRQEKINEYKRLLPKLRS